ncbi:MAG: hypothetical protein J6E29_07625 [Prevotella sp.]|nr:hypothetical protein [Prevotella sp.]
MKYIEKIDSYENESTYVKSCFSAMRTIAANPDFVADSFEKKSYILERNYILTMVYLMGKADCLREDTDIVFGSQPYLVGGENDKHVPILDETERKTGKELHFADRGNKIIVIPDLVIHSSHSPIAGNTGEGQYLALEAKTSKRLGQTYFNRDYFKLNLYLDGLHFQNVVYLVINKSASTIDDFIGSYITNRYYQYFDVKSKLRLFIQEKDTPEMYKLK